MAKRACIYTRVSTASRSRYGNIEAFDQNPEVQETPLRELAAARGWEIAAVYTDRASGAMDDRPGLLAMLDDARRAWFDVLLVWRFDRLSRNVNHFLELVSELRALKVDLVSHQQALDTTTPMGQFVLTMFAALAQFERETIRDRIVAGLEHARKQGTKSGRAIGRPRLVFARYQVPQLRSQGLSWRAIADQLGTSESTVRRAKGDQ